MGIGVLSKPKDLVEIDDFCFDSDSEIVGLKTFSASISQNWTEQALECYRLKCDCSKCSVSKGNYSFECKMPEVLDVLIMNIGKPDEELLNSFF